MPAAISRELVEAPNEADFLIDEVGAGEARGAFLMAHADEAKAA